MPKKENEDHKETKDSQVTVGDIKEDVVDHEEFEDVKPQSNYKKSLWMLDINDNFSGLIDEYIKIDDRLRWIGMFDILYGRQSCYGIRYDSDIVNFIEELLNEIDKLVNHMNKKNLHIIEDDKDQFERLLSLNRKKIYSRIAFCLEK